MDGFEVGLPPVKLTERFATLDYLESKVREEAVAAARACSVEASSAHVELATRYAEHFSQCAEQSAIFAGQLWVEKHRLW